MPKGLPHALTDNRAAAIADLAESVGAWGATSLSAADLRKYSPWRHIVAGWRLQVPFSDQIRALDVLVDVSFPRSKSIIALAKPPPFLTWPHVERDGVLCLLNEVGTVDPANPCDVMYMLLGEAFNLVEELTAGKLQQDFQDEFLTYWDYGAPEDMRGMLSLMAPRGPTRPIIVWRGKDFFLLGESEEELKAWLNGFFGHRRPKRPYVFEVGLLLWQDALPIPANYPKSSLGLQALMTPEESALLNSFASKAPGELVVALGASTPHGACFGGVSLSPQHKRPDRSGQAPLPLDAGFRPGAAPEDLLAKRFYGSAKLMRTPVQRVDSAWVHGRDQDPRQERLSKVVVTMLGCGSVGAAVAVLLAQSGVGHFRLVDSDGMKAANVSRHPLGVDVIGRAKVMALAEHLRKRFPHIKVDTECSRVEHLPSDFDLYGGSDLVISAMGCWSAEGWLNVGHLSTGRRVPILYGWTEPHAMAGHAVLVDHESGCLQCGLDRLGTPFCHVTEWPQQAKLLQEPSCGAVYQPYGAIELNYINSMIADLALSALLGTASSGEHRIWAAGGEKLEALGGRWSDAFKAEVPTPPKFGFLHQRVWSSSQSCQEGHEVEAAA